jgi:hypothetical protein
LPIGVLNTNCIPAVAQTDANAGLAGWWKLSDGQGVSAADASGHKLVAQLKGPPRWTTAEGLDGGALELDGVTNSLACSEGAELSVGDQWSVAAWFKGRSGDPSNKRMQVLLAKGEAWQLQRRSSDGMVELSLAGLVTPTNSPAQGRPPVLSSKRNLDDGKWHHVVGSYDGARTVLYVDGEEENATPATGPLALTTASLTLGESSVAPGHLFSGWMADVRLYSRGLQPEEVRSMWSARRKP